MSEKQNANMMRFQAAVAKANITRTDSKPSGGASAIKPGRRVTSATKAPGAPKATAQGLALIVEPDKRLATLLANQIRTLNLKPVTTDQGLKGVKLCEKQMPKLVLISVKLPDTTGYDCCSKIRALPEGRSMPVLMTAVEIDERVEMGAEMSDANGVVKKPFKMPELMATIRELLTPKSTATE